MPRKKPVDFERVRGSKACTFCSRRKIKCNGLEPCSACDTRSIACTYPRAKKRGPPSKLERQHKRVLDDASLAVTAAATASSSPSSPTRSTSPQHPAILQAALVNRARARTFEAVQNATSSQRSNLTLESLADMARIAAPNSPRRDPSVFAFDAFNPPASLESHPSNDSAYPSSSNQARHTSAPSTATSDLAAPKLNHCDMDQGAGFDTHPVISSLEPPVPAERPSPVERLSVQVVDQLLIVYQYFVHLHWPIIYLPSLSSLRVLSHSHPLLFHAVLAVAASTQDSCDSKTPQRPHHDSPQFGAASLPASTSCHCTSSHAVCPPGTASELVCYLKRHVDSHRKTDNIETIQVLILLALVEMGGGDSSNAYLHASMACAHAINLGLHRHPTALPLDQVSGRPQERQRVLWGCYVLDKTLAAALERPMMLRRSEIEVDLPSTDERDEYDIFVNDQSRIFVAPDRAATMTDVKCRCISSFRSYCDLMMILERILVEVYSPKGRRERRDGRCQSYLIAVIELDADLRTWRRRLPMHLQWKSSAEGSELLSPSSPGSTSMLESLRPGSRTIGRPQSESTAQDGVPPQVLTMRAWFSACMLLLHRPRLALDQSAGSKRLASDDLAAAEQLEKGGGKTTLDTVSKSRKKGVLAISGSRLVRAAATEICELLPKYQATFSVRRIASSWVYLIFQSAVIHSTFLERTDTSAGFEADLTEGYERTSPSEAESMRRCRSNDSKRLFQQCIRSLEQMSLTWRGASHHVATLRRVAESLRITRASTPTSMPYLEVHGPAASSTDPGNPSRILLSDALTPCCTSEAAVNKEHAVATTATALAPLPLLGDGSGGVDRAPAGTSLDWLDFWNQMPSSSEDVWMWQQFIDLVGNATG